MKCSNVAGGGKKDNEDDDDDNDDDIRLSGMNFAKDSRALNISSAELKTNTV